MARLVKVLPMRDLEMEKLEASLAFECCHSLIATNCVLAAELEFEDFYDVRTAAPESEDRVADAVRYLDSRGLLRRDPLLDGCVAVLDESEASDGR